MTVPVKCRIHQLPEWVRKVLFMGRPFIRAHFTFCLPAAIGAFWLTSACCQEAAKQPKLNSDLERCRRINNEHMRMQCFEQINSKAAPVPQQQPTASGTWQLTRTSNPSGGPDAISITKITNPTPSEQGIEGLMLRCAEGATTNVLIVLATPLSLRVHPKVIVVAGARRQSSSQALYHQEPWYCFRRKHLLSSKALGNPSRSLPSPLRTTIVRCAGSYH